MKRLPLLLCLLASLAPASAPAPALAQELRPLTPLEQAAQAYRSARWPASAPPRAGVPVGELEVPGFAVVGQEVDPERGEATLTLAQLEVVEAEALEAEADAPPAVLIRLRLLPSAAAARKALLGRLATVQTKLRQEEGLGDVAFGGRRAGRLELLVGTLGNVSFEVRSLIGADVASVAAAVHGLLRAAPRAAPGPRPAPRLLAVEAAPARVGRPTPLALDFDPSAPEAAHVRFACSGGAAVLKTDAGWELYASRPGPVTITIHACSDALQSARFERTLEVAPAGE